METKSGEPKFITQITTSALEVSYQHQEARMNTLKLLYPEKD